MNFVQVYRIQCVRTGAIRPVQSSIIYFRTAGIACSEGITLDTKPSTTIDNRLIEITKFVWSCEILTHRLQFNIVWHFIKGNTLDLVSMVDQIKVSFNFING